MLQDPPLGTELQFWYEWRIGLPLFHYRDLATGALELAGNLRKQLQQRPDLWNQLSQSTREALEDLDGKAMLEQLVKLVLGYGVEGADGRRSYELYHSVYDAIVNNVPLLAEKAATQLTRMGDELEKINDEAHRTLRMCLDEITDKALNDPRFRQALASAWTPTPREQLVAARLSKIAFAQHAIDASSRPIAGPGPDLLRIEVGAGERPHVVAVPGQEAPTLLHIIRSRSEIHQNARRIAACRAAYLDAVPEGERDLDLGPYDDQLRDCKALLDGGRLGPLAKAIHAYDRNKSNERELGRAVLDVSREVQSFELKSNELQRCATELEEALEARGIPLPDPDALDNLEPFPAVDLPAAVAKEILWQAPDPHGVPKEDHYRWFFDRITSAATTQGVSLAGLVTTISEAVGPRRDDRDHGLAISCMILDMAKEDPFVLENLEKLTSSTIAKWVSENGDKLPQELEIVGQVWLANKILEAARNGHDSHRLIEDLAVDRVSAWPTLREAGRLAFLDGDAGALALVSKALFKIEELGRSGIVPPNPETRMPETTKYIGIRGPRQHTMQAIGIHLLSFTNAETIADYLDVNSVYTPEVLDEPAVAIPVAACRWGMGKVGDDRQYMEWFLQCMEGSAPTLQLTDPIDGSDPGPLWLFYKVATTVMADNIRPELRDAVGDVQELDAVDRSKVRELLQDVERSIRSVHESLDDLLGPRKLEAAIRQFAAERARPAPSTPGVPGLPGMPGVPGFPGLPGQPPGPDVGAVPPSGPDAGAVPGLPTMPGGPMAGPPAPGAPNAPDGLGDLPDDVANVLRGVMPAPGGFGGYPGAMYGSPPVGVDDVYAVFVDRVNQYHDGLREHVANLQLKVRELKAEVALQAASGLGEATGAKRFPSDQILRTPPNSRDSADDFVAPRPPNRLLPPKARRPGPDESGPPRGLVP